MRDREPSRRRYGPRIHRTTWVVLGVAGLIVVSARFVALGQRAHVAARANTSFETRVLDFGTTPAGPMRALALVPRRRAPGERFPLLIAFHGRGEANHGVERGAWGWLSDYELGASDAALRRRRLPREAFLGLEDDARLGALRADLARRPYGGLVVVTPYTPDVLDQPTGGPLEQAFDAWVVGPLLARARAELPVLPEREATGIDGVSLGGLHSLWIGLGHPEAFGTVGALQPAVRGRTADVAARFVAGPARPFQRLRLVTSTLDPLRPDTVAMVDALHARGAAPELRIVRGPHDYIFNQGPGGIEMLFFHDRAQRNEAAP